MTAHKRNCLGLIFGVAAFLLVLTPSAFAKKAGPSGEATIDCGDGVITYSPTTLWPPNHKMQTIDISFAESELVPDNDTLGLQVTDITSNQVADDDAGTGGCGPKTSKQGDDWTFDTTPVSGPDNDDTMAVSTSVQVRSERCGKDGGRVYTISVTCTDEGTTDSVELLINVPHSKGKKQH